MTFKPDSFPRNFIPISINKFVDLYQKSNPDAGTVDLRENLKYYKTLKSQGQKCACGNPIWIIGSAIAEMGCFTCITGEIDNSNDYEIK